MCGLKVDVVKREVRLSSKNKCKKGSRMLLKLCIPQKVAVGQGLKYKGYCAAMGVSLFLFSVGRHNHHTFRNLFPDG